MIEIDGLTKRYGDKTAVDGLSFVVEPGVVIGFLGRTGWGRRTSDFDTSLHGGHCRRRWTTRYLESWQADSQRRDFG